MIKYNKIKFSNVDMLDLDKQNRLINFWRNSANKNWKSAKSLFDLKHYDMCLFCCHLAIEKNLKALIVAISKTEPPHIHDLNRLAGVAKLEVPLVIEKQFEEITKFNVQARYDDIKLAFYKKATKEFTKEYLSITKKIILWLKEKFPKK